MFRFRINNVLAACEQNLYGVVWLQAEDLPKNDIITVVIFFLVLIQLGGGEHLTTGKLTLRDARGYSRPSSSLNRLPATLRAKPNFETLPKFSN